MPAAPDQTDAEPKAPQNTDGQLFDEKDFAAGTVPPFAQPGQTGQPVPPYGQPPIPPYGYGAPVYSPAPGGGAPADPVVPPLSEAVPQRKPHTAVLIICALVVVGLLTAVMLLLARNEKEHPSASTSSTGSSDAVNVTIEIDKRPADDKSDYADEASGLFTVEGAAKYIRPSTVSVYCYLESSISPYASGSGVIISEDGYIVTNAHVIEDVDRVNIQFYDDTKTEAKVVAFDKRSDLAVLKVNTIGLTPAVMGSSSDLSQGETILTYGNADGFESTATIGIVSCTSRQIDSYSGYPIDCIQVDAALNHGQSGGPVIDMYGRVVGIVVSKHYATDVENIGFAISTDFAKPVIEDLIAKGYVTGRAMIGIHYSLITPDQAATNGTEPGLLISSIIDGYDIANTDLKPGDIITEIDGRAMNTASAIKTIADDYDPGDKVKAKVYRKDPLKEEEGEVFEIEFTFGELSNDD